MPRKLSDNGIARTLAAIIAAGGSAEAPRILKPASVLPPHSAGAGSSSSSKAQHAKRATSSSPAMAPATSPPISPARAGKKAPASTTAAARRRAGAVATRVVRFDEAAIERVREFDRTEPTATVAAAPVYSLATDSEVVKQRAQRRLSEEEVSRGAQAFHLVFFDDGMTNPRRVDTKALLAKELRAELAARGLPTGGTRVYLQARLDQYLRNHGAKELEHTSEVAAKAGSSPSTPVLIDEEEEENAENGSSAAKSGGAPGRKRVTRTNSIDALGGVPSASQLPPRPRTRGAVAAAAAAAAGNS